MTQAICDITTDEVNVDVVVEPQADTMVEVANRAGGMEQVFHDNTLIGNGNSVDLRVNTDIIATKEYVDEKKVDAYTKSEIDNKITVINTGITGNAQAIQKTRDDMNAEDGRLQTQITAHAGAITVLQNEQTATGNQIQNIESKIPDGTSETNPLINKQQLLDEEMDIREDLNESVSELQTQITAQAAEIAKKQDQLTAGDNIKIVDNVISATGGGGASLPDQTGNAGAFLQTDGASTKWAGYCKKNDGDTYGTVVFDPAGKQVSDYKTSGSMVAINPHGDTNTLAVNISGTATGTGAVSIGVGALASGSRGVAVGPSAKASGSYTTALGYYAEATAQYSVQLGAGKNPDANTFKVYNRNGNFEMMSADGTIPAERMSATTGTTGQVLTKTDTGMAWQDAAGGGGGIADVVHDDTLNGSGTGMSPLGVNTDVIATKDFVYTIDAENVSGMHDYLQDYIWPEINTLKSDKQDKLTAGDGISISGNTISATGTGGTKVIIKRYS